MAIKTWVSTDYGKGLLSDATKPLPEPRLICLQGGSEQEVLKI